MVTLDDATVAPVPPLDVTPQPSPPSEPPLEVARPSMQADTTFFGLIAVLLDARMTLSSSLQRLAETALDPAEKELCQQLLAEMESGVPFVEAAQRKRDSFSERQLGWLAVAHQTGDLELILSWLFRFEWMNSSLRLNLTAAALYLLVIVGLATLVLGGPLGLLCLIAVAGWASHRLWKAWEHTDTQLRLARLLIHAPGLGRVLRSWMVAQFSRALAILLESGAPVAKAITLGGGVVGTRWAEFASQQACAAFFEERSLTLGLSKAGYFSSSFLSFVSCSEETGSVAQMMAWLADEAEIELHTATSLLYSRCRKFCLAGVFAVFAALLIVPLHAVSQVWKAGGPAQVLVRAHLRTSEPNPTKTPEASKTPTPQPTPKKKPPAKTPKPQR